MKKNKQQRFTVTFQPFGIDILICLGGVREDAIAHYLDTIHYIEKFEMIPNERAGGHVCSIDDAGCMLWLKDGAWAGLVAHECFHAVHTLLKSREIPLIEETEELYAYSIEWLFNQIVANLKTYKECEKCLKCLKKKKKHD